MSDDRPLSNLRLVAGVGFFLTLALQACHGQALGSIEAPQRFERDVPAMGISFRLVAYSESAQRAEQAFESAAQRLWDLDAIFSDYRADSESRQLVECPVGQSNPVGRELWELMRTSDIVRRESEGAFDITIGPVTRLWRFARKRGRVPADEEIRQAMRSVGGEKFELVEPLAVILRSTEMRLDFGAIGKGYAADECLAIFQKMGLKSGFVDASGNIAFGAPPPDAKGWSVAIAQPDGHQLTAGHLEISNCGIATSSDALQGFERDGARYSHIVDPRNGQALTRSLSVTVVADSATIADAWGTALSVLGPTRGIELVEPRDDIEALIVTVDDGSPSPHNFQTKGFPPLDHGALSTPQSSGQSPAKLPLGLDR